MVYKITIATQFDIIPTLAELEQYYDKLLDVVDTYTNHCERSFCLDDPREGRNNKYICTVDIEVNLKEKPVAKELFCSVAHLNTLYVTVVDKRFDPKQKSNVGYWWSNEGETWYHDSQTGYTDPYYDFHVGPNQDYSIVYIPVYAARFDQGVKERYENSGATYMWRCTASWDNFMKATTIEDAIEEFEVMYKEKLWQSVEGYKKSLDRAIDAFSEFDQYRWNKRG